MGMSHDPWNFLGSNKEAAVLIRAIGKTECYITATSAAVLHPAVRPVLKDPRVETLPPNA